MIRSLILVVCFSISVACSTQKEIPLSSSEWRLHLLNGESVSNLSNPITLSFDIATSKVAGFAGCNRYFSTYAQTNSSITFSNTGSTKMFCTESMDIETRFLTALDKVASFKIEEGKLIFLTTDQIVLEFIQ